MGSNNLIYICICTLSQLVTRYVLCIETYKGLFLKERAKPCFDLKIIRFPTKKGQCKVDSLFFKLNVFFAWITHPDLSTFLEDVNIVHCQFYRLV